MLPMPDLTHRSRGEKISEASAELRATFVWENEGL